MTTEERSALVRKLLVLCLLVSALVVLGATERTETAHAARCCQECPKDMAACEVTCAADCDGTDNECFYPCVLECENDQTNCLSSCVTCGGGGGGGGGELCAFDGPYPVGDGSYVIDLDCPNYSSTCQSYGPGQTICCDNFGCYVP